MKRINPEAAEMKKHLKGALIQSIRNLYSAEEEFRIVNKGMMNNQDKEYLEYRKNIDNLVNDYRERLKGYE